MYFKELIAIGAAIGTLMSTLSGLITDYSDMVRVAEAMNSVYEEPMDFLRSTPEDFEFTAECQYFEDSTVYEYSGSITDKEVISKIWKGLNTIEATATTAKDFFDNSGDTDFTLTLKNKENGKQLSIYDTTLGFGTYYDPENNDSCYKYSICFRSGGEYRYYTDISYMNELRLTVTDYLVKNGKLDSKKTIGNPRSEITDKEYPKEFINLIETRSYFSDKYYFYGIFIDCYGNIYDFDLTDTDHSLWNEDELLLETLYYDFYYKNKPVAHIDNPKDILEIWDYTDMIDEASKTSEKASGSADMGQHSLIAVRGDSELIEIFSEGDWNRSLEDNYAKKIRDSYKNLGYNEY